MSDQIVKPPHYTFSHVEPINVIEAWRLGFCLGNVVKYVARAEHKGCKLLDLKKARWYLTRVIDELEAEPVEDEDADSDVCASCDGSGVSRFSNRPDDYGPHTVCSSCRGSGTARDEN